MNARCEIVLAIDASRNRSGGAINHLYELIKHLKPYQKGFKSIHLWSYKSLLLKLPDYPWLHKHSHNLLEKNIFFQVYWQKMILKDEFKKYKCDIILNTDAGSISNIKPSITMSRDMLSYEKGEIERFKLSLKALRLLCLRYIQNYSLKNSNGAIFLTKYASSKIQKSSGKIKNFMFIPHGLDEKFHNIKIKEKWPQENEKIKIIYVSNAALYKHQWNVIEAVSRLKSNLRNKF